MGHVPDWARGSMGKGGATPVKPSPTKHGVVSRELFHNAKPAVKNFYDGGLVELANPSGSDMTYKPAPDSGELNIKGEKVGVYEGNDPIAKYRMNMTDGVGGKSLRLKDQEPDEDPLGQVPQASGDDALGSLIKTQQEKFADKDAKKFVADTVVKASRTSMGATPATQKFAPRKVNVRDTSDEIAETNSIPEKIPRRDTSDEIVETEGLKARDYRPQITPAQRSAAIAEGNKQTGEYGDAGRRKMEAEDARYSKAEDYGMNPYKAKQRKEDAEAEARIVKRAEFFKNSQSPMERIRDAAAAKMRRRVGKE